MGPRFGQQMLNRRFLNAGRPGTMRSLRHPSSHGRCLQWGAFLLVALVWIRHDACADQAYNSNQGYFCSDSGKTACDTFALYRSQTGHSTVQTIAALFNANSSSVAALNKLTNSAGVGTGNGVIVPIDCRCNGNGTSYANLSYTIKVNDTFFDLAGTSFESLTTVSDITSANNGVGSTSLEVGQNVVIPIRCACPSSAQLSDGMTALVTYPVLTQDSLSGVASSFGVSVADIASGNSLAENSALQPQTTLLVPIKTTEPNYQSAPVPTPGGKKGKSNSSATIGIIVGSLVAGILILCCLVWALCRHPKVKEWRLGDYVEEEAIPELSDHILRRVSYKHLSVATKGFSDEAKLGQGGFGSVYKGVLPTTGSPVAVKKISQDSNQGEKEFMTEVSIISQLRHRNLIQLLGYCKDRGKFLIVYELMPNGSLDKALFLPPDAPNVLTWDQRFNIVLGTARAVVYLHQGFKQQVIHRDIKASNIMLDDKWDAKLGDFGLARLVDHLRSAPTTLMAGTYGYIAPEAVNGRFTEKTDVFAFGAVVLEVACGRNAVNMQAAPAEVVLVDWVWRRLSDGNLLSVVDKRLTEYDTFWMETMLLLGLLCSHPDAAARPSMSYVVQVLSGEVPVPPVPSVKPSPSFSSDYRTITLRELHGNSETTTLASGPSTTTSSGPTTSSFSTLSTTNSDSVDGSGRRPLI